MKIKVSPSILSADFCFLADEINRVSSSADMLHLDVMDGHFVPNISIGLPVVNSINKFTDMFLDVHLMISRPQDFIDDFVAAGADLICFHLESDCENPEVLIDKIHSLGKKAAISVKPKTPINLLIPFIEKLDMVLIMTVEPGFGGQKIIMETLPKIRELRLLADKLNPSLDIEVDGGINRETAKLAVNEGANVLVAGSFIFCSSSPNSEIQFLQTLPQSLSSTTT